MPARRPNGVMGVPTDYKPAEAPLWARFKNVPSATRHSVKLLRDVMLRASGLDRLSQTLTPWYEAAFAYRKAHHVSGVCPKTPHASAVQRHLNGGSLIRTAKAADLL